MYNQGDIGWEVYFVSHGVIDALLPNVSAQVEDARPETGLEVEDTDELRGSAEWSSLQMALDKEAILGNLYREGNHFGETCLVSRTGVRLDTTTAVTVTELFSISREEIESTLAFLPVAKRETIMTQLLSCNGHIKHTVPSKMKRKSISAIVQRMKIQYSVEDTQQKKNKKTFAQVLVISVFSLWVSSTHIHTPNPYPRSHPHLRLIAYAH